MHFKYEIIPAGKWARLNGTKSGSNEPRPHFVPVTDSGRRFIELDVFGLLGKTGLCPGEIFRENKVELGYRFLNLTEEEGRDLLAELNKSVCDLERASQ
jgi:hypothetical protein